MEAESENQARSERAIDVAVGDRRLQFPPGKSVILGRGDDVDIVIDDPTVGRHHAVLSYTEGVWTLIDSGSRNGTWLGDQRLDRFHLLAPVTVRLGASEPPTLVTVSPLMPVVAAGSGRDTLVPTPTEGHRGEQTPEPHTEVDGVKGGEPPPGPAVFRREGTILLAAGTEPATAHLLAAATEPATAHPAAGTEPATAHPAAGTEPATAQLGATGNFGGTGASSAGTGGPVMVVRLGDRQLFFPVGTAVRIGRDPTLEVVSVNPLVSRHQHGLLTSDLAGATYTDSSSRGTFLHGRRLTKPLRITDSVTLVLGDPSTGEELGITPPLTVSQIERHRHRRATVRRVQVGVIAAIALAAAAGGVLAIARRQPAASRDTTLSPAELARAESATVRLLLGSPSDATASGSGTLISPSGLILTNGHVAEPQAPGEAVAQGIPGNALLANPDFLTVEMAESAGGAVAPRYQARPVAVDGYLDLALVQIDADASGKAITPSSLHLPFVHLGNDAALRLDQPVTVLGFPGVSDSDSLTVTSGVISTFIPDPLMHDPDPRFELETTARVAHGNSGGAAIDNAGNLIGVPSLTVQGEGGDVSWRLRPVAAAGALMTATSRGNGSAYRTPWLVPASGLERAQPGGWSTEPASACGAGDQVPQGTTTVFLGFSVTGLNRGVDLAAQVVLPDGTAFGGRGGLPQLRYEGGACVSFALSAGDIGIPSFPAGIYQVQLLVGPSLRPLGLPSGVFVG